MVSKLIKDGFYVCEGSTTIFNVLNVINIADNYIEVVGIFVDKNKNAYDIPKKYSFKTETIGRWERINLK